MNSNKIKRIYNSNKYIIIFMFFWFILGIGGTYAYYFFRVEDGESVIAGNIISIDAELEVDLVVGNNGKMVPMQDAALSNALNGVGSTNGACIDRAGNLSCQVYRIRLINEGSKLRNIIGTIKLYDKEGTNNSYANLKWRELTSPTIIKEDSVVNNMYESYLVKDLTIASKETLTWYIAVWISETGEDQKEFDKGEFGGTVTFTTELITSNVYAENIMAPLASSDSSLDFSKTSEETNTNGVYLRTGTENNVYPTYYYRGNVNNNLIFADTCWKVVRTTETGGLKLIYNGLPSNGQCNNTGTATTISNKTFNPSSSPAYLGYMYGTPYIINNSSISSSDTYVYGNGITYSNGKYTLTNTITEPWSNIYDGGLNYNHYTCFTTETTCSSVYYINYSTSNKVYYITLTNGKTIEDALSEMLDYNTTSSTIKGNNTTEGTLDWWYYTNISLKGYNDYIEDTVWCNDRSINRLGGFEPNGGSTTNNFVMFFSPAIRIITKHNPSLTCNRDIDRFTVSEHNGNGSLNYPIGLLTVDEIVLAGADNKYSTNESYYLSGSDYYWSISPYEFYYYASGFNVYSNGTLEIELVNKNYGVRPTISIKPQFTINSGNGTTSSPYTIVLQESEAIKTYTVSYNANGGNGAPSSQTKTEGESLTLSSTVPTRENYKFVGWGTTTSDTVKDYDPGSTYSRDGNITLYAIWEFTATTYTISYNANGGNGAPNSQNKIEGTNLTLSSGVPTRDGYDFIGWGTTTSDTTKDYDPGSTYSKEENITLYAIWQAKTYTVSYNANNGSGAPSNQTKTHGTNLTLSSGVPTRDGYDFIGWGISSSDTTKDYDPGSTYSKEENITLYAIWKVAAKKYTISYNANGGSGAPSEQTKTEGTNLTLSSTVPTRTGYKFLGWSTSSTATNASYSSGGTYGTDENTTLYAVWFRIEEDFSDTTTDSRLTFSTPITRVESTDYKFSVADGRFRLNTADNGAGMLDGNFTTTASISFTTPCDATLSLSHGVESSAWLLVSYSVVLNGSDGSSVTLFSQSSGNSADEETSTASVKANVTYTIDLSMTYPKWYSNTYGYIDNIVIS